MTRGSSPSHVVIAGGGFAALETALALRAMAGNRVELTLVAPNKELAYRPAATIEAFDSTPPREYDLLGIAEDLGASFHRFRVEAVAPQEKWIRLASGARLSYDSLVMAIGTRARTGIAGALTFRDQRDVPLFRRMLDEVEDGLVGKLVFAVPTGCSWPLPLYELALLSATRVRQLGTDTQLTIVSPEHAPLEVFGRRASDLVADALSELDVRFMGGTAVRNFFRDGSLELHFDTPICADRVVAVPQLTTQRITGVPAELWGFVPTDSFGRVQGLGDVYAAGDMTTYPIKQGALAAQQADRIAYRIATSIGAPATEPRRPQVLIARLLAGDRLLSLRTELDREARPTQATIEHAETFGVAPSAKLFGRYLTPYLERRSPIGESAVLAV